MRAGVTLTRACQIVTTDSGSQIGTMSLWLEMAGYYQYQRQNRPIPEGTMKKAIYLL